MAKHDDSPTLGLGGPVVSAPVEAGGYSDPGIQEIMRDAAADEAALAKPTQPKDYLAGWEPTGLEKWNLRYGEMPPSLKLRQLQQDIDLRSLEDQRRTKQETRLYEALQSQNTQRALDNDRMFLENVPMHRSMLNRAKTPAERKQLAEQLAKMSPKGPAQALLLWMGQEEFKTAAGGAVLDWLTKEGMIDKALSSEETFALMTNVGIQKLGLQKAGDLASQAAAFATSHIGRKDNAPLIYAGMSEEDFIKEQMVGLSKMSIKKGKDGTRMADEQDADLLKYYYKTPEGQAFMAGFEVQTSTGMYKQQLYNEKGGRGGTDQTKSMSEALQLWTATAHGGQYSTNSVKEFTKNAPDEVVDEFNRYYYQELPKQRAAGKEAGTFGQRMTQPVAPKELEDQFDRKTFLQTGRMIKPQPGVTGGELRKLDIVNISTKERETIAKQGAARREMADFYGRAEKLFTAREPGELPGQATSFTAKRAYDTDVRTYISMRNAFTGLLARTLAYEVGTMTEGDVSRARNFIPSELDTAATVRSKKKAMFDYLNFQEQASRRTVAGDLAVDDKEFRATNDRMLKQADEFGAVSTGEKPNLPSVSDLSRRMGENLKGAK